MLHAVDGEVELNYMFLVRGSYGITEDASTSDGEGLHEEFTVEVSQDPSRLFTGVLFLSALGGVGAFIGYAYARSRIRSRGLR